ncbi:PREDICTED: putative late blight resistance protein homolog R1A-10 [Nicotiana attenuata]|uniref:putative late blight resistance protein homolog R1A-10 n=1 Tax=Nicotiana attenuata TaxID=49451 RepID=UPI000904B64E|nr:PREDICTED: putative late blight resistance protein homolog R1A-10 [Nicotiana attenuata]
MVGYNIEQTNMLSQLTRDSPELEVIAVTGMGGIGKSTFAKKLFSHPSVLSFFDIRGWITVSEDYSYRKMLLGLLKDVNIGKEKDLDKKNDSDLAVCLKQSLMGRRYLIVVDDIWSKNAWDEIRLCLPDDGKRSRVLLTTRDIEVAQYASSLKDSFKMHLLGPDDSWNLFHQKAFAEKGFPIEFEDVGKDVAKNCKGLPLMIAVVAKILSSKRTLEEWRKVAESVSSLADVDAYQQCSGVLALSYNHLPSYLKGCFLYFGLFPKASEISMEKLIRLWIAEGLLKVKGMEGLEEVAASHLNHLIDKSLVIVSKRSMDGKIMKCMIHDLVHDFCLKEADCQNLLYIVNNDIDGPLWVIPEGCRWVSQQSRGFYFHSRFPVLAYSKLRSFSVNSRALILDVERCHFKLLRVLDLEKNEVKNLVLENIQTVSGLIPSCCTKEIFEAIKKVKKLEISGKAEEFHSEMGWLTVPPDFDSDQLPCLINPSPGSFPPNLKKLTLSRTCLPWNCMNIFSKLPNLEVLELKDDAFSGVEWEITEMGFRKLKFLLLEDLYLRYWTAADDYFQCLERVCIKECTLLKEIPEGFADSVTLQLIELHKCRRPLVTFAKQIQEKHEELGNNMLKVYAFDSILQWKKEP